MRTWFHRHPHLVMLICVVMSFGTFMAAEDARTLAGRLWLYYCFACWTGFGYQAWRRT